MGGSGVRGLVRSRGPSTSIASARPPRPRPPFPASVSPDGHVSTQKLGQNRSPFGFPSKKRETKRRSRAKGGRGPLSDDKRQGAYRTPRARRANSWPN